MKKDKTPNYINIGILTVITTISWIFFSAYRTLTAKPTPNVPAKVLASLNPTLDTEKISQIEGRTFYEEGQAQGLNVATPTPTPTIEPTPTPIPSPTPIPIPTETPVPEEGEESTGSGELSP